MLRAHLFVIVTTACLTAAAAHSQERLAPNLKAGPAPLGDHFVGRKAEFAQLDGAWKNGKTGMVGVIAWGGFGKSAMVRQWLFRHEQGWPKEAEPDGIFWHTVRPKTDAQYLYTEVMNYFYRSGQKVASEDAPIEDKLDALKFAIGDRRAIIVLDGLEPLQVADRNGRYGAAIDPLLRELLRSFSRRSLGRVLCVVTSRLPLADVCEFVDSTYVEIRLEERLLTDEEANLLLKLEGVTAGSLVQKSRLIAFCHHHPLALKIAANLLKAKAGGDAANWEKLAGDRLLDAERPQAALGSVQVIMDVLAQQLSTDEKAVIQFLARIPQPKTAELLRLLAEDSWPLGQFDPGRFDAALVALAALRVVDYNDDTGKYSLHPLVAEYFGGPPSKTGLNR